MAGRSIELIDKRNNIFVEAGSEMSLATGDLGYCGKCIFVGQKEDRFMVVTPPSNFSSHEKKLVQAKIIMVSYLYEGDIYEFTSKVLEIKHDPLRLILLQYPVAVEKKELRAQKRISCFISAKMETKTETQDGIIKDISKSGCRCFFETSKKLEKELQIDDHISLSFGFPGISDEQEILGKIKDIRKEETQLDVGIKFEKAAWWVPPYD